MTRLMSLVVPLILTGAPSFGEDIPNLLASWSEDSGSLPPEFHWQVTAKIHADQSGSVTWCKGYADGPPGCATTEFEVTRENLERLEAAILSGGFDRPPKQEEDVPIGGGSAWGSVALPDGTALVKLPSYPVKEDQERVRSLLALMKEITPADALATAEAQAESPAE